MSILEEKFHANNLSFWKEKTLEFEKEFSNTDYSNKISVYSKDMSFTQYQIKKDLRKFGEIKNNFSISLNEKELDDLIIEMYLQCSSHYKMAEKRGLFRGDERLDFPNGACFHSSQNILLSNIRNGNQTPILLWKHNPGHAYIGTFFELNDEKGILITDPTSKQLGVFGNSDIIPNNLTFIAKTKFDYDVQWPDENTNSLYPDFFMGINEIKNSYHKENLSLDYGIEKLIDCVYSNIIPYSSLNF